MRPLEGFAGGRVKLGRHQFPLLPKVQRGKGGMSGEGGCPPFVTPPSGTGWGQERVWRPCRRRAGAAGSILAVALQAVPQAPWDCLPSTRTVSASHNPETRIHPLLVADGRAEKLSPQMARDETLSTMQAGGHGGENLFVPITHGLGGVLMMIFLSVAAN